MALVADLERYADCRTVMTQARAHFGRIDILINNVGGTIWASPMSTTTRSRSRPRSDVRCSRPSGAATRCCRTCSNRAPARSSTCRRSRHAASTACRTPPPRAVSTPSPRRSPSNTRQGHPRRRRRPRRDRRTGAAQRARPGRPDRPGEGLVPADRRPDDRIVPPEAVRDAGRASRTHPFPGLRRGVLHRRLHLAGGRRRPRLTPRPGAAGASPSGAPVNDHVYRVTEIVGSSSDGLDQADPQRPGASAADPAKRRLVRGDRYQGQPSSRPEPDTSGDDEGRLPAR